MFLRVSGRLVLGCLVLACQRSPSTGGPSAPTPAEAARTSTAGAVDAGATPGCLEAGAGWTPYGEPLGRGEEASWPGCCPGLVKLELYDEHLLKEGKCIPSKGGRLVCTPCGNGHCEAGESRCNCPADCP